MKILVVSGIFPPDIGGPATYSRALAGFLTAMGHEAMVVCLSDYPSGETSYAFGIKMINRHIFKPLRILKTVVEIRRPASKADIVYAIGLHPESAAAVLPAAGKKTVLKFVGDTAWERARVRLGRKDSLEDWLEGRKTPTEHLYNFCKIIPLKLAGHIIVPCEYLKAMLISQGIGKDRITVLMNALPPVFMEDEPPPCERKFAGDGGRILAVCRLVPWKGLEALVNVVSDLNGAELTIIGEGPMRGALERRIAEMNLSERVHLTGALSNARVRDYMRNSDVFVLNSSYEGAPHVLLEAMNEEIPIAAAACGGIPEMLENGMDALLFPPNDENALRSTLARMLTKPGESRAMAARGKKRVMTEFDFQNHVHKLLEIFQRAMDGQ